MTVTYAFKKIAEGLRTGDNQAMAIGGAVLLLVWYRKSKPERELLARYEVKPGEELTIKGVQPL